MAANSPLQPTVQTLFNYSIVRDYHTEENELRKLTDLRPWALHSNEVRPGGHSFGHSAGPDLAQPS